MRFANAARACSSRSVVGLLPPPETKLAAALTGERAASTATAEPMPIRPSPTASRGLTWRPASVFRLSPVCCTTLCAVSVPPSTTARLNMPDMPGAIELSRPEPVAVPEAQIQSSLLGTVRPLFSALCKAIGPSCCRPSKSAGPVIAPTVAPPAVPAPGITEPAAAPIPIPAMRVAIDPKN